MFLSYNQGLQYAAVTFQLKFTCIFTSPKNRASQILYVDFVIASTPEIFFEVFKELQIYSLQDRQRQGAYHERLPIFRDKVLNKSVWSCIQRSRHVKEPSNKYFTNSWIRQKFLFLSTAKWGRHRWKTTLPVTTTSREFQSVLNLLKAQNGNFTAIGSF